AALVVIRIMVQFLMQILGLLLLRARRPDFPRPFRMYLYPVPAVLAAGMLFAMPNAATLWMAVLTLWILDASVNFTMGPYRAFVADQLPAEQRATGYLMYMFFASLGAVVGSLLPWVFAHLGVTTSAPVGEISAAV